MIDDNIAQQLFSLRKEFDYEGLVGEYESKGISLHIGLLKPEKDYPGTWVLIEGDWQTLLFLADLILARALDPSDCGYQMAPGGPGNALFEARSEIGIYIHRLPCVGHPMQAESGHTGEQAKGNDP